MHLNKQAPFVLWFTGLSGVGKSTLAEAMHSFFVERQQRSYLLDGDVLRKGLSSDLGFSDSDRTENIRRAAELANTLLDSGCIVLAALISPKHKQRQLVRNSCKRNQFVEIYVDTPFEECERRDVKGLYKKARTGELKNFTGIDSDYEVPAAPDIHIKTEQQSLDASVKAVISYLVLNGYIEKQ